MNQNYYGIFTTNDRTKTSFAKLTENLIQIDNSKYDSKDTAENSGIWVSKNFCRSTKGVSNLCEISKRDRLDAERVDLAGFLAGEKW